jgi:flagellar basal body rod protein FlgC
MDKTFDIEAWRREDDRLWARVVSATAQLGAALSEMEQTMSKTRRVKTTKRATAAKLKAMKRSGRSLLRKTKGVKVKRAPRHVEQSESVYDPHDPNLGPK